MIGPLKGEPRLAGDVNRAGRAAIRRRPSPLRTWNRKLHYYVGLYFLFFIWLFAFSGLLLNHPGWSFASFWPERREIVTEVPVAAAITEEPEVGARMLAAELGLVGELNQARWLPGDGLLTFQLTRPGRIYNVEAGSGVATVTEIRLNGWGVLDALHKFTGVSVTDPERTREWWLTRVWSFSMDALAVGLIVLVCTGIYLWWRLPAKRVGGLAALFAGTGVVAYFLLALSRIY